MLPTRPAIFEWMLQHIASSVEIDRAAIDPDARFESYGLDSLEVAVMIGLMEEEYDWEMADEERNAVPSINGLLDELLKNGKIQDA